MVSEQRFSHWRTLALYQMFLPLAWTWMVSFHCRASVLTHYIIAITALQLLNTDMAALSQNMMMMPDGANLMIPVLNPDGTPAFMNPDGTLLTADQLISPGASKPPKQRTPRTPHTPNIREEDLDHTLLPYLKEALAMFHERFRRSKRLTSRDSVQLRLHPTFTIAMPSNSPVCTLKRIKNHVLREMVNAFLMARIAEDATRGFDKKDGTHPALRIFLSPDLSSII